MCVNFIDLNANTHMMKYGFPDTQGVVDQFQGCTFFTAIDLKAGFHNLPVSERASRLLGVITQDGLFRYLRLPFGLHSAPLFF